MRIPLIILAALLITGADDCESPQPTPVSTYCHANDYSIANNVSFGYEVEGVTGGLAAILHGDPSDDIRATVQVTFGQSYCTGVVIDRNWVLTAAHCGYGDDTAHTVKVFRREAPPPTVAPRKPDIRRASAETGLLTDDPSVAAFEFNAAALDAEAGIKVAHALRVESHTVHSDYWGWVRGGSLEARKSDLMLLKMADPVPDDVQPIAEIYNPGWAQYCNGLVAQGFGRWGGNYLDLRETKYVITTVTDKYLVSRADNVPPGEQAGRICFGDSGGPLYADVGGVTYLAGITTTTMSSDCELGGTHVRVEAFRNWLIDTMGAGT